MKPGAYESFVREIMGEIFGVEVYHQKNYVGRVSKRQIAVDLSIKMNIGGADFLVLIECKCYTHSVGVDDVEEFHSKLDDIGAHKGILVTTSGFQSGAIKTAMGRGIALAILTAEAQPGEIKYVVNGPSPDRAHHPPNPRLLQGNVRGLLSTGERGMRFETFGTLYGMLCIEFMDRIPCR